MAMSPADEHTQKAFGWAARDTTGVLSPFNFSRRSTGPKDVTIKILYCGVCHSDLHFLKNEWGFSIVGVVTQVGGSVRKFRVGDTVAVGCMVGGCDECDDCNSKRESYCRNSILTYNDIYHDGTRTYGGYSDKTVVEEHYVLGFPDGLPMAAGAPLLCAGITVYSPMRYFGLSQPGTHLGVVGLGGLGHLAVKFAKAFGVKVTVISTSPGKQKEAMEELGADAFILSRDEEQIKLVAGSATGGIEETQEMLHFASKHNITADVEVIPMKYINVAMERLAKGDVKYRFVIDVANTLPS
ncbi:hypothetical protein GW17_00027008 [Ensete ventricosum]|nr:hypothetical protein GW17_00027008 [Ensete ventricosum]RZR81201.1 hypothetical protein BHM03_00007389 [Ensete ventricosum]